MAQIVETGCVKEYNERMEKTPLDQVEIIVSNAGSTVSDSLGNFVLEFRTLKVGDKVSVRRIEKIGYEVFNTDVLDHWVISNDDQPFSIVMCKSEKFKRIRDNYSAISSASYEKQMKKEMRLLEVERKEGRIKEEQYQYELFRLNEEYDKQLENLDNYIDKFSRIDLSELSDSEAAIIELLQQGDVETAIAQYEELHLLEKYQNEINDVKTIQIAKDQLDKKEDEKRHSCDSLKAALDRQVNAYYLIGGKENIKKIGSVLKVVAMADTTNLNAVWEYARYAAEQSNYQDAFTFYKYLENSDIDYNLKWIIYLEIGNLYRDVKNYENAEKYYLITLRYVDWLFTNKVDAYYQICQLVLNNLFAVYVDDRKYDEAKACIMQSIQIAEHLQDKYPDNWRISKAELRLALGMLYYYTENFEESEGYLLSALELYQELIEHTEDDDLELKRYRESEIANIEHTLGALYSKVGRFFDSEQHFRNAMMTYQKLFDYNPVPYSDRLAWSQRNLASVLVEEGKNEDAIDHLLESISTWEYLYAIFPDSCKEELASVYNSLAYLYLKKNDYEKSIESIDKAISLMPEDANYYDSKGEILLSNDDIDNALKMWQMVINCNPNFVQEINGNSELYKQLKLKGLIK
jgi:tetratricopeptide (TPR) repeat protein